MIQEKETGFLVPPGNVLEMADRLRWILKHPRKAQEMGHKARQYAEKFFSEELYIQGYSALFENSLASNSASDTTDCAPPLV